MGAFSPKGFLVINAHNYRARSVCINFTKQNIPGCDVHLLTLAGRE